MLIFSYEAVTVYLCFFILKVVHLKSTHGQKVGRPGIDIHLVNSSRFNYF